MSDSEMMIAVIGAYYDFPGTLLQEIDPPPPRHELYFIYFVYILPFTYVLIIASLPKFDMNI